MHLFRGIKSKSSKSKSGFFFKWVMSSEKFQNVLKDDFKVLVKIFMLKCPKSRRIWGMSRAESVTFSNK